MNSKTELALPLRAVSATPPLDLHFIMEHGHERYAAAFCSERSKADAIVSACNTHSTLLSRIDALRAGLEEAITLRVKLYRHSDLFDEDAHLTDAQIAQKDDFARRWSELLEQRT